MTSFGTRLWMIVGIIFVGVFSFFADDLNYWFHQRVTVEHPKTDSVTRYTEPAQPPSRLPDGTGMKEPAWSSNVGAEDHASTGSGQTGAAISRSDLLANRAGRPIDVSRIAKVERSVDRDAGDAAAQATVVQDQAASASEEKTNRGEQRSEPAQKDLTSKASLQPLDEARRGDVAKADAEVGGTNVAAAKPNDMAAAEETINEREQRSEPAQKDLTSQAPSQPLDEARRGDVAKADAEGGGAAADAAAKPNDMAASEEKTNRGEQRSEPAQKDVTSQAPLQPLDEVRRGDVVKADAEVGSTNVDAVAKPNDMAASEEKTNGGEQRNEPAQKDVTAQASSQPLDEARRSDVAKADTEVGGTNVDADAKPIDMPAEQTSNLPRTSEQPKDVAAIAVASQSRDDASGDVTARARSSGGEHWVITETMSPVDYSPVVTAWISSKPGASGLRMTIQCRRGRTEVQLVGDRSKPPLARNTRDIVVAYSINDDASIAQRWDVRGSVAAFSGDAVAFLRSLPEHGELTARMSDGNSVLHEGRFVLDGLSHVRDRFALACGWPEADAAAPAISVEVAAVEQTSNLSGQQSDQAEKDVTARPRGDAPVEFAGRMQAGIDALQPNACGACQLGALKVLAGDRWVISETTSPVDYSPIVTASILLQSGASRLKLSIICRRGRTDLELASDFPENAAPKTARDIVVTHWIDRDAPIEHRWDARGSVAYFKGDAIAFLRSLTDDGEFAVRVSDGKSVLHEGRFVLDGLSHVRNRFASACKWPEAGAAPTSQAEAVMRKTSRRGKTQ